ncbi:4-carboxy-4-hydroxy-2-oxoadipate aldolase/oxaloacetate decarboxylase [Novosphingobium aerophilum]|uniref:4-carboxy-4-hydroxy-2-oxoadipate aldolase/oxaloacetate decarboxylase n=1 Tax=Novosphingobium TaxID=165696 RepID=UPI0006C8E3F8|nr:MULTISPECIES: 4-carboxy-4-hydroxy-2-oxoadipate aldolase/oxaloacetate decarboxylase [unclassified Novosphingobium]KPH61263.1 dimethylmenaquinone methyltransferase [Novosphingobium sp. ST904]MPS68263.1 4-carboxy-4-hydroxy-2-oxoadipate aldolase/oxaloacetate decarboxylase [Novosphingobium sp.]TCM35413.1 4-hydroxy-4-methyl-2-oxoglutarate aldolase [Novosphingobium sp. ST904]WRT95690.1 4-carboxy-4-hydroxy-2-oxoadipate aldolase/oxaloacetate decarboxylase [Novosphingobium sp. RL4]
MTAPLKSVIYKRIPRPDPELVARAARFGVADLHEGLGEIAGRMCLMSPAMAPISPGQKLCGPAVTAWNFPGDNLAIHAALYVAEAGDVLVLTNGGGHQGALWGDVACTYARRKGLAGTVVHGAMRDVDAIRELDYPVWSTAVSVEHPKKRGPVAVNVPLVADGVLVEPGDVVVGDSDGVLVIPRAHLLQTVESAEKRAAAEVEFRRRIGEGEVLFEVLGMDKVIADLGIEIHDCTWGGDL